MPPSTSVPSHDVGPRREVVAPTRPGMTALLLGDAWTGHGSLAPTATRPASRSRPARRVPALPLDLALVAHVAELGHHQLEHRRLRALIERLGFSGRPPLTLAQAGRLAGITGERVRQLEVRLRRQQVDAVAEVPLLDAALAVVAGAAPLPAAAVPRLLLDAGLTARPFSAQSLRSAAGLLGRRLPFVLSGTGTACVVLPAGAAPAVAHATAIEARARRQAQRRGASTIDALLHELVEDDGLPVSKRQLRVVLEACGSVVDLGDGWFAFRDPRPNGAFARASLRMLAVRPELTLESIRDGLRRHNAFRRLPPPPAAPVLAEVYRRHPLFRIDGTTVSAAGPVAPSVMGPLNQRMVEILGAAPGGVLPRAQLLARCHDAGLNLTSVNLYTTYSECLERVGPGQFAARGTDASPVPGAARRRSVPVEDRPTHGWTPAGRPWMAGAVTPGLWANGVVHVPAELRAVLDGRHFAVTGPDGSRLTTIGIDRRGNSWGWTRFLRRSGALVGDVARAVFDPAAGTAELELLRAGDGAGTPPPTHPPGATPPAG